MQGQFWLVKDRRDLDQAIANFKSYIINDWDFKKPLTWQPKEYKSVRSISQNALFHMWVREITEHFISRGGNVEWTTEENVKLYIKQQFLGFEDIRFNKTVIPQQLKSTRKLDRGEMYHFMDQVYYWSVELGCHLTLPKESEYMKIRAETNA